MVDKVDKIIDKALGVVDEVKKENKKITIPKPQHNEDDIDNPHFTAYTPPELVRNIHILHETYLI